MTATARIIVGVAITLAAITGFAGSVSAQQSKWCDDPNATVDQTISGCTADIQSGRFSGKDLAGKFNNRGIAYTQKGQYDRAIADHSEAIRLNPNYARAFGQRCVARYDKDDNEGAIADCSEALRLDNTLNFLFNWRGSAYELKGDFDRAISDYTEAIKRIPNEPSVYGNRCMALIKKKEYRGALTDCDQAIRLAPKAIYGYYNRAKIYEALGERDRAIADYRTVFTLGGKSAAEELKRLGELP